MRFHLRYRIPGKGPAKERSFATAQKRADFLDRLMEREGDDLETSFAEDRHEPLLSSTLPEERPALALDCYADILAEAVR